MTFRDIFAPSVPPPRYNVCEWADEFRFLSSESSARPGKYRTAFAPYQREPMESVTDPAVQQVVMMFASQLGKTEILNNVTGFFVHGDPAPLLMVQPTVEFAESWSKERFTPMVRDTPALKELVSDSKSRDSGNTILHKSFPGGNIAVVGANAPAGLAGRPRRVVLLDEVDRYPASAGTEGDPVSLAVRRTESFWNAIVVMTSTPTTKGLSRIEASFLQTDQRMWHVPCHACGVFNVLKWSQVKWEDGQPETASYVCESCETHWTDDNRRNNVLLGEWRRTAPFTGKRGYWINGINSPFKHKRGFKNRLHQMASDFLEAKAGGSEALKTWVNTFLAETWEEDGDSLSASDIQSRLEDYNQDKLPEGVLLLTAGADVQKDRIEAEIVGWGDGEENWGIVRGCFLGDTEKPEVWERFRNWCSQRFNHPLYGEMRIAKGCIDAGYRTDMVLQWCARAGRELNMVPVMGARNKQRMPVQLAKVRKSALVATRGAMQVDTHTFKVAIYTRLKIKEPGPRFMHFPKGYDDEYFAQLTAEKLVKRYVKGFPVQEWEVVRPNKRNEALDIRVYNHAALWILQPNWAALKSNLAKLADKGEALTVTQDAKPTPRPTAPPVARPPMRGNSFVNGWRR